MRVSTLEILWSISWCGRVGVLIEFDRARARFAVDVGDGKRPEGSEIDPGDELGEERGRKLPVPAEEVGEQAAYTEIDQVVWRRFRTRYEERKDNELDEVGEDGEEERGFHARAGCDCNFALNRIGLPRPCSHAFSIADAHDGKEAGENLGNGNSGAEERRR